MKPLHIRPLAMAKYPRHRTLTIEEFYEKHQTCKLPNGDVVVLVPNPITSESDLEVVLQKIREASNV